MKRCVIHESSYEKNGWISIEDALPEKQLKVKLAKINFLDWNLESLSWETTGWLTKDGIWSLKQTLNKEIKITGLPTHWKNI